MKRYLGRLAFAAAIAMVGTSALAADPPKSVRIGYAISLSGPMAQGAAITTLSGYKLWIDDVNKRGGLKVQGFDKPIPIEIVEYDDTSNAENAVRLVERLMTQDKVDFVLPPWSTGFNLATAPVFARNGYPQLAVTANSNDAANLVKQMPTLFFFLNEPRHFGAALGEVLSKLKSENKINNKIAMLSIADQFGAEFTSGVTPVLERAGFQFALRKSYPAGSSDLTNEIKEAKAAGADSFVAYSYPPDTFMLTNTAVTQSYNPKVFHVGVGTAFAALRRRQQGEGGRRHGTWRLGSERSRRRGLPEAAGRRDQPARRRLGRAGDLCEPAGARAGDREGRHSTVRSCSTQSRTPGRTRPSSGRSISRPTCAASNFRSGSGRTASSSASRPADLPGAKPIVFPKPAW